MTTINDLAGNAGLDTSNSANYAIDTKEPTLVSVVWADNALRVGETSLVTITFSESVAGTFSNSDLDVPNGVLSAVVNGGAGTVWTATFTPTDDLEDAENMIIVNTRTVTDAAGNAGLIISGSSNYAIDTKEPTVTERKYEDTNTDGQIDRIKLTFSEATTYAAYVDGNWTVAIGSSGVTSLDTTGGTNTASTTLNLTATAAAGITGKTGASEPTLRYTGTTIVDAAGNALIADGAGVALIDGANPVVMSVVPEDSDTSIDREADLVITFSEPMTATFDEGVQFETSDDPGDFEDAWTSNNSIVTLTHEDKFDCSETVEVTTAEGVINAAAATSRLLIITGPVSGDWSFRTDSCNTGGGGGGSSSVTSTTPVITLADLTDTTLAGGDEVDLGWSTSGSGIDTVGLYYSTNGGTLYSQIAYNLEESLDEYTWTVPNIDASNVVVKIIAYDSGKSQLDTDVSDTLTITSSGTDVEVPDEDSEYTSIDEEGRTIADSSGDVGPSPITGEDEDISVVVAGQFIRSYGFNTIYYVDEDLVRHPFWDSNTFFTYADSFDEVVWVTDATLPTMTMGSPILPQAGVVLVKIQSDPKVYAIDTDNVLRWVPDEATAITLYGESWADYVIDLEPTTFARFSVGDDMTTSDTVDRTIMKTRMELAALAS